MTANPETHAECPFCKASVLQSGAVEIAIWPTAARETSQGFFAHRKCLREAFPPGTLLHPALFDDEGPVPPDGG
jgi:hypothetical protein